jgi:DNA-binding NtrC family response regulator
VERALGAAPRVGRSTPPAAQQPAPRLQAAPRSLREVETETLREQLAAHRGSRADLARTLGISERSLYRKLRALQMP